MLTNLISNLAISCLLQAGYFGAAFLMALESMIAPVPSEAALGGRVPVRRIVTDDQTSARP